MRSFNAHDVRRSYTTAAELKADFASGALHPGDVKPALARQLNAILQPVRDHFERDDRARELLKQVKVSDGLSSVCSLSLDCVLTSAHCHLNDIARTVSRRVRVHVRSAVQCRQPSLLCVALSPEAMPLMSC